MLTPVRPGPSCVPSGCPGGPTEVLLGSSEGVDGSSEASGALSFLSEAFGGVDASVPFVCPRSVPLALWGVSAAPLAAG